MLSFSSLLVFSDQPKILVEFYKKVLQTDIAWSGGDFQGLVAGKGFIAFGPHDKIKGKSKQPERIMCNFDAQDVKKEFERVKKLGAKVVQEPYHPSEDESMWVATFADPDNNYFQLMTPMPEMDEK
jgi:predicted enzyme related to lactoylglutathione lyase